MKLCRQSRLVPIVILLLSFTTKIMAQGKDQMVRLEAGVLTYYAVADKSDATHITILEIYADTAAYKAHLETSHFKKYKETVQHMVRSLELIDVNLIGSAKKPGI